MKAIAVAAFTLILIGCATKPSTFHLTKPPRPVLPTIQAEELECLSVETYHKIVRRNGEMKWYAEELEAVIDSTRRDK